MAKHKDIQGVGFTLADDWKLVPLDDRNWELCHRHVAQPRGGREAGTEPRWYRCGRFYSYNTVDQAMLYVIDQLAKENATDQVLALASAMRQWQDGVERIERAARSWQM